MTTDPNTTALIAAVDETLAGPAPQMLLVMASALVESVAPGGSSDGYSSSRDGAPDGALAAVVALVLNEGSPEAAALAWAVSEIAGDDALRDGTSRSLSSLRLVLPDWLYDVDHSRVDGVLEIWDVVAGSRTLVIGVELPGALNLCLVVILDLSARLRDVYVLAASVQEVRDSWTAGSPRPTVDGTETSWMEYPALPDVQHVVLSAIDRDFGEPLVKDTWPASRPFVNWALALTTAGKSVDDGMTLTPLEYHTMMLEILSSSLGVDNFAEPLSTVPLPDEEFDWTLVPDAVHARTSEVLLLVDACADALFDTEFRTACRRYLARVATDVTLIAGRASATSTAAAIVWNIHRANHDLVSDRMPQVTSKAITEFLGAKSSPTSRAQTIRTALGIYDQHYVNGLQSSDYLTSATRIAVQQERNTHRAAIIELTLSSS